MQPRLFYLSLVYLTVLYLFTNFKMLSKIIQITFVLTFDLDVYLVKMPNQNRIFHFLASLKSKCENSDVF